MVVTVESLAGLGDSLALETSHTTSSTIVFSLWLPSTTMPNLLIRFTVVAGDLGAEGYRITTRNLHHF